MRADPIDLTIPDFLRRPPQQPKESDMPRKSRKAKDIEAEDHEEATVDDTDGATPDMTEDQLQALFFSHKRKYESALAAKKEADAAFKNACKVAKAELGDNAVDYIKVAILLDTEEGEATVKARIERLLRVARWMNVPLGAQADLFGTDHAQPATERAFGEGKKAGMESRAYKNPYAHSLPQHDSYAEGYDVGQKAIFAIQKKEDDEAFDAPPPVVGDQEATHVEAVH